MKNQTTTTEESAEALKDSLNYNLNINDELRQQIYDNFIGTLEQKIKSNQEAFLKELREGDREYVDQLNRRVKKEIYLDDYGNVKIRRTISDNFPDVNYVPQFSNIVDYNLSTNEKKGAFYNIRVFSQKGALIISAQSTSKGRTWMDTNFVSKEEFLDRYLTETGFLKQYFQGKLKPIVE